jgi:hypothetical protein
MKFKVISLEGSLPSNARNIVYLKTDGWDDWFKYSTMYNVFYYDTQGERHRIGEVKIGKFGMTKDQRRPDIPDEFETLSDEFFSLGQDDSYYENLNELGEEIRGDLLVALRDVAQDPALFERAVKEDVTGVSLLRSVSNKSVRRQFRRMAQGGARLSKFSFSYTPPPWSDNSQPPAFAFQVVTDSTPPTNVHVLIGRNAVGKTHTIGAAR